MEYWNEVGNLAADRAILQSTYERTMNVYGLVNGDDGGWSEEEKVLKYADVPCGVAYRTAALAEDGEVAAADCVIRIFCDEEYEILPGDLMEIALGVGGDIQEFVRTGAARHYGSHQELTAVYRVV